MHRMICAPCTRYSMIYAGDIFLDQTKRDRELCSSSGSVRLFQSLSFSGVAVQSSITDLKLGEELLHSLSAHREIYTALKLELGTIILSQRWVRKNQSSKASLSNLGAINIGIKPWHECTNLI
jgi:hypothetical protein